MEGRKVQTEWQTCWSIAKAPREHCHNRERAEERAREQRGKEKAMPAVERLGRTFLPLSVWLRDAAPEEIKKRPGMVVVKVVVDGDKLCIGFKKTGEKKYFQRTEASLRSMEIRNKQALFSI